MLGDLPVQAIDVGLIMQVLDPIWQEKPETADRVRGRIDVVLNWATARGYRHGDNPARWRGHLDKLLPKKAKLRRVRHMAAMPYAEVPALMARLQERPEIAAKALEFAILTAARTAETLGAQWSEIDFEARLWTVPAERIKGGREHRVPLSDRAVAILQSLPRELGNPRVFISARQGKPLAEVAMLAGAARPGHPLHGARIPLELPRLVRRADQFSARTRRGRAGARAERQERRRPISAATCLEKRRRLMRAWAGYCASPARAPGEVVPLAQQR